MNPLKRGIVRIVFLSLIFLPSAGIAGEAATQATEPASLETVLKEVRAIREKQEELEIRITKIQKMLEEKNGATPAPNFTGRGPDQDALDKIKLPDNPTKDQVRQYVQDIAYASRGQNEWSSEDPQIEMLERVGPANLDVLLDALGSRTYRSGLFTSSYLFPAIKALVRNEHKEMILKLLPQRPQLAEIILENGWAADARSTLVEGLRAKPNFLPPEWIEAVASFKDPATYESLKYYLANGRNPEPTYEAIKGLPNLDLTKEVGEMWARLKNGRDPFEVVQAACVAADYGHLDALQKLVNLLETSNADDYYVRESREAIARLTDASGSSAEIVTWFKQNKDNLVFDAKEKKFVVKNSQ